MNNLNINEKANLEQIISNSKKSSKKRIKKYYSYSLIPIVLGTLWLGISFYKLNRINEQKIILSDSLSIIEKHLVYYHDSVEIEKNNLELFKYLRDSLQIDYLTYLQNSFDVNNNIQQNITQSITAHNLLKKLIKTGSINKEILIWYYQKNRDSERVKLSLQELGYNNVIINKTTRNVLKSGETNTIAIGSNIALLDVKIVSLSLIRAGFKIQHIYYSRRNKDKKNLMQVIRTAPSDGSPDMSEPISVDKIRNAKTIKEILH